MSRNFRDFFRFDQIYAEFMGVWERDCIMRQILGIKKSMGTDRPDSKFYEERMGSYIRKKDDSGCQKIQRPEL